MTDIITFITDALDYYDKICEKSKDDYNNITYINFENITDKTNNMTYRAINMFDKDNNLIDKKKFEVLGIYISPQNIWSWSWAIPKFDKMLTVTSKKILNYGIEMDPQYINLKKELVTSRYHITRLIQVDLHVATAAYLSKKQNIFKYYFYADELAKNDNIPNPKFNISKRENDDNYELYYLFIMD